MGIRGKLDDTKNKVDVRVLTPSPCPAAGGPPGTLGEQWASLSKAEYMLALAPGDEILGELLTLQAELAAVTATNRARLGPLLDAVRRDLPAQRSVALGREAQTETVKEYILVRNHAGFQDCELEYYSPRDCGLLSQIVGAHSAAQCRSPS